MSELPKNFNWENVLGFDFTGKVKDQGACGSCYAMASTSMLESRVKIHFGKDFDLSTQFTLQCNFMTEGCHGGWGVFKGFFLENFYTVLESCAPYEGKTQVDGC